jgi:hypothetical protein
MSGLDEQIKDLTSCPSCGGVPSYFTIDASENRIYSKIWIYSKKGSMNRFYDGDYGTIVGNSRGIKDIQSIKIESINYVYCSNCNKKIKDEILKYWALEYSKKNEGKKYNDV